MAYSPQHLRQALQSAISACTSAMAPGQRLSIRTRAVRSLRHLRGFRTDSGRATTVVSGGGLNGSMPCISHIIRGAIDMCALPPAGHSAVNTPASQSPSIASAFSSQASAYANALSISASDTPSSSGGQASRIGRSPALCRSIALRSRAKKTLRRLGLASSSQTVAITSAKMAEYVGGGSGTDMCRASNAPNMNRTRRRAWHTVAKAKVVFPAAHRGGGA